MRLLVFILSLAAFQTYGQATFEVTPFKKANTPYNDFSAVRFGDEVFFCSNKKNDIIISHLNAENQQPLTYLYQANYHSFGKHGAVSALKMEDPSKLDHGPFSFAPDSSLFFTRSYQTPVGNTLGIFVAQKTKNGWGAAVPFAHNHSNFNVAHPTISPTGTRMYFAANFADTRGKSDLYFCDLVNGEWGNPINLGPSINSSGSELFPFIHADGTLYFSSNRPGGTGELDIYKATENHDGSYEVELLPAPFNSASNDFGFWATPDNSSGYFSSNRNGSDDLFEFQMAKPGFKDCAELQKNSFCYMFYDSETINLDTLPLQYEWTFGDGQTATGLEVDHCYEAPGTYQVSLNIVDTLTRDLFFSQAKYELVVENIQQVYIDAPDTISRGDEIAMSGLNTYLPGFEVESYHWYFPDESYAEGAEVSHAFSKRGEQTIVLGVRSKPSAVGVVEQACIQKHIVVVKSEDQPLTASAYSVPEINESENSTVTKQSNLFDYVQPSDTVLLDGRLPEETIFRVEIKQSKSRISTTSEYFDEVRETYDLYENYIPSDSVYSYAVGQESELCNTYPIYSYVKTMNYSDVHVKAYLPEHVYNLDEVNELTNSDLNQAVFRTGSIYFELESAELKPEAEPTLNKVLTLLNNFPSLQLEVGAHTDKTGKTSFNDQLSNARASAVIKYLTSKSIQPERLVGVGYGSAFPIGDNDTKEGRELNRRVEFKVISSH